MGLNDARRLNIFILHSVTIRGLDSSGPRSLEECLLESLWLHELPGIACPNYRIHRTSHEFVIYDEILKDRRYTLHEEAKVRSWVKIRSIDLGRGYRYRMRWGSLTDG